MLRRDKLVFEIAKQDRIILWPNYVANYCFPRNYKMWVAILRQNSRLNIKDEIAAK